MAKQEISEEDFKFYYRMASLQQAMITNSVVPVCVWRSDEGGIEGLNSPGMYYDCCEDSEKGISVMKKRISIAGKDIVSHFDNHRRLRDFFIEADSAIVRQDRRDFGEQCGMICAVSAWYSQMVYRHIAKLDDEAFLTYPNTSGGTFFDIVDSHRMVIPEMRFNPNGSFGSLSDNINEIHRSIDAFRKRNGRMPYFELPAYGKDGGSGFYDINYGENIKRAKILLERVGMKVKY